MRLDDYAPFGRKESGPKPRSRWALAQDALELLVPKVVERDDDGISLYFFSSAWEVHRNVTSASRVRELFALRGPPKGGTRLEEPLRDAVQPDNFGTPETILVITVSRAKEGN